MIKIEASTLEDAYASAAAKLTCSVTQLQVEIVQYPSKGFLGMFQKSAIIVARCSSTDPVADKSANTNHNEVASKPPLQTQPSPVKQKQKVVEPEPEPVIVNDTIMPESFVTHQEETFVEPEPSGSQPAFSSNTNSTIDAGFFEENRDAEEVAQEIYEKINTLFAKICFDIDPIKVCVHDKETILVEFTGKDAALLIGKEGYRYKALSYMIFNWISAEYNMQLRLEIAEFLKNQEESISRYLVSVSENIERDGRAQTKVLDGVLVQIALKQLRDTYPDKYVAIRSTRDGLKFIIINDYNDY